MGFGSDIVKSCSLYSFTLFPMTPLGDAIDSWIRGMHIAILTLSIRLVIDPKLYSYPKVRRSVGGESRQ